MAATKISNLTPITDVELDDEFVVAQAGESKKMTVDQIRTLDAVVISDLGDEATYQWQLAIVTDDINGPSVDNRSVVYSDGTDWRRMSNGTVLASRPVAHNFALSTTAPTVT